jgi:hypothetical protein
MSFTVTIALPILDGVKSATVTSPYGERVLEIGGEKIKGFHYGIDLKSVITNIKSAARGKVIAVVSNIKASQTKDFIAKGVMSSGNYVRVQHGKGHVTSYRHLAEGSVSVQVGDVIEKGTVLGKMGSTGFSTGNHLHFDIEINGTRVDPLQYLTGQKFIPDYQVVTIVEKRPELPALKVITSGLRYRDAANGNILGYLAINTEYPYLGITADVEGYQWAQIIIDNKIAYTALNPSWNEVKIIEPKCLPFDRQIEVGTMLLSISLKEKP